MPLDMEAGLGPDDIMLDGDPAPTPQKGGTAPPQFLAHVYCAQTAGWIKMALGMEVGLGPGHIVLDRDPAPLPKKGAEPPPIFGPFLLWPNGWMHQDATWYGCSPQPRRLYVGWGPSYPQRKAHTHPSQFLAHVYCGQTAGWMKTPVGTEVDLGPGHFILEGFPAIRERGTAAPPLFRPMSVVATVAHLSYC